MRKLILSVLFLIIFSFGAVFVWQPLFFVDFTNYTSVIWLQGYKYKSKDDIAYLEKNLCEENQKNCACIFMVHGLGDAAVTWRKVMRRQEGFSVPTQVIALDLPGAGASAPFDTTPEYQVSLMAKTFDQLTSELCQSSNIMLVGNSFGGWITSWMMKYSPDKYMQNVLLNPAGLDMPYEKVIEGLIDPSPEKIMLTYRLSHNFGNKAHNLPWFVARHASARMKRFPVEDMIRAQQLGEQFIDGFLPEIKHKSQLLWGLQDQFLGETHLNKYRSLLSSEHIVALANCAHVPQDQCPQEVFLEIDKLLTSALKH